MNVEQIHAVAVDLQSGEAKTTEDSEVPLSSLQETLGSKYHISAQSTVDIQQGGSNRIPFKMGSA